MAQLLVNGLALGAAYALVALGFVLIVNATGAVNFAQGDLVVAGGFLAVAAAPLVPVPALVLVPAVAALMAVIGLVLSLVAYLPLSRRPPVAVFISTIAAGLILENGVLVLFGPAPRSAPPLIGGGVVELGGLVVARQSLAIIGVAVALIAGQQLLFHRTQLGRWLRATAQDAEIARACGIPVVSMVLLTFALAAAYAGTAGLLLANQFFITPSDGGDLMLRAYIAVTIGGWGSVGGAVAGAVLIAVFETVVAARLGHPVATGLLYGVVLVILAVRPRGLFGEAAGRRA